MPRHDGQAAQDLVDRQRHTNNAGRTDEKLVWVATETFGGVIDSAQRGGVADCARGAVRVAGIYDHGAHAAFGFFQVLTRNNYWGGDDQILRKDRSCAGGSLARKHGEIECTGFFQAAGRGGETKATRQGRF